MTRSTFKDEALADQFSVSVATAYRAVSLLHDRDLVVGQPGRGVYVAGEK
ncbi:HTH domain-containing protein [Micromonospora sp. NPDC049301]